MKVVNGSPVSEGVPDLTAEGRLEARRQSVNCPDCGGEGLVTIDSVEAIQPPRTAGATCGCTHGRWLHEWHRVLGKGDLLAYLPELAAVLAGEWPAWRYQTDLYGTVTYLAPTRADINAMFRRPA